MNEIKETLALNQHHDAVTGTSESFVADDFIKRLNHSINITKDIIFEGLNELDNRFKTKCSSSSSNSNYDCLDEMYQIQKNEDLYITILNPGVNESLYPISILVNSSFIKIFEVDKVSLKETEIDCDIFCSDNECSAHFFVNFEKTVFKTIIAIRSIDEDRQVPKNMIDKTTLNLIDSPNNYLSFDLDQGFTFKTRNFEYKFQIAHGYLPNDNSSESSSYIMAPNNDNLVVYRVILDKSQIYKGKNFIEILLVYLHSTIKLRIIRKDNFEGILQVESIMKPKDYDPKGMEFFLVMQSNLNNNIKIENENTLNPEFWTDENSMKMMRRIKDFRGSFYFKKNKLIADNFYPVNSAISLRARNNKSYVRDEADYDTINKDDPMITILNDRAQAGGILDSGQLLLNLNRWSISNNRGLNSPLRESQSSDRYFKLRHVIMIGKNKKKNLFMKMLQKTPISIPVKSSTEIGKINPNDLDKLTKLQFISYINQLITINELEEDCLEIEFNHLDLNRTLIQIFNLNDPYFDSNRECHFNFNMKSFPFNEINEVSFNSLKTINTLNLFNLKGSLHNKNIIDNTFIVQPQDFRTFIFSLLK